MCGTRSDGGRSEVEPNYFFEDVNIGVTAISDEILHDVRGFRPAVASKIVRVLSRFIMGSAGRACLEATCREQPR
jgi:hypothetical protein